MDELQLQLKKALTDQQSAKRILRHLDQLDRQLQEEYKILERLGKVLEKENKDYEALQGLSLKGLFHKVLGSQEEQVEKEKQEYLKTALEYDEASKTVDLMEYERKVLQEKVDGLQGMEQKIEQLLQQREQELIRKGGAKGRQLLRLAEELDAQYRLDNELGEALKIGEDVLQLLFQMHTYFQEGNKLANDRAPGLRFNSFVDQSTISKAHRLIPEVRMLLLKFEEEFLDVFTKADTLDLSFKVRPLKRFGFISVNTIFSDWAVLELTRKSMAAVRSTHKRVKTMNAKLWARRRSVEAAINQLDTKREKLLAD
ncbi:MAG: hypothetical protein AAGG75_28550 [Bacteroidota bacterium]